MSEHSPEGSGPNGSGPAGPEPDGSGPAGPEPDGIDLDGAGPSDANGTGLKHTGVAESDLVLRRATFRCVAFRDPVDGHEHLALVLGEIGDGEDVLVRVHSECVTGDVFGALRCECGDQLRAALDAILAEGRGMLVYLRGHEGRGIGLVNKVRTQLLQDERGLDTVDSATALGLPVDVRDYGPAARVLRHRGVRSVRLLSNNPAKVRALEEHGIKVAARVPLLVAAHADNTRYLTAKRDRLGHDLPHLNGGGPSAEAPGATRAPQPRSGSGAHGGSGTGNRLPDPGSAEAGE
ncbi:3,4-dihydroxy 2-butanone 4-phosphate synthase/GTP cyclohydrolase II [Nocardiopsis metallicus]|uniref:GTP cyclohydrolase-2 n=1 Tax=Nocardiopsis metallicus TaxID=179819 RepID=A0A840W409_9ACTN|nr:3,4-dihydroxy 2-butanone 4-phosphate synthase/GTP cyclohydrolase II [Nocardiopsis metallicus]